MGDLAYGEPKLERHHGRSSRGDFDKCEWPDGLHVIRYDDGTVKVGWWDRSVAVTDISNFKPGESRGSGFMIARFTPMEG